jgi:hypothetical protein
MSGFVINDCALTQECEEIAAEIIGNTRYDMQDGERLEDYRNAIMDAAHDMADWHEWVIYNHKALMLCAHCDTQYGEEFLADTGTPSDPDIYTLACIIAYGEMRGRIERALVEMLDAEEAEL